MKITSISFTADRIYVTFPEGKVINGLYRSFIAWADQSSLSNWYYAKAFPEIGEFPLPLDRIDSLALHNSPGDINTLYVNVYSRLSLTKDAIFKSTDNGQHWEFIMGLEPSHPSRIRVIAVSPNMLLAGGETLSYGTDLWISINEGTTWYRIVPEWEIWVGRENAVHSILFSPDPDDPWTIFLGMESGYIIKLKIPTNPEDGSIMIDPGTGFVIPTDITAVLSSAQGDIFDTLLVNPFDLKHFVAISNIPPGGPSQPGSVQVWQSFDGGNTWSLLSNIISPTGIWPSDFNVNGAFQPPYLVVGTPWGVYRFNLDETTSTSAVQAPDVTPVVITIRATQSSL
jgi:hypothetical protein